jgi:hypothetical protein
MSDRGQDNSHTYDSAFDDVDEPKARAERDRQYVEQAAIERAQFERAEKIDKLLARLEKLAAFKKGDREYENAQAKIEEIKRADCSPDPYGGREVGRLVEPAGSDRT